jgi:thioredoxin reductase
MTAQNKPAIIGFGPAGIFAALELIERGENL